MSSSLGTSPQTDRRTTAREHRSQRGAHPSQGAGSGPAATTEHKGSARHNPAPLPRRPDGSGGEPTTGPIRIIPTPDAPSRPLPTATEQQWRTGYVTRMRIVDALAIVVTLVLAQVARFSLPDAQAELIIGRFGIHYLVVGLIIGLLWWCALDLRGTRAVRLIGSGMEEARQVLTATLMVFSAVAIVSYALALPVARGYVLVALPAGAALLILGRVMLRSQLIRRRRAGEAMAPTMIVGRRRGALETAESLRAHVESGLDPVAVYTPTTRKQMPSNLEEIEIPNALAPDQTPSVSGILEAVRRHRIQTLVLTNSSPLTSAEIRHLSWYLADAHVRLVLNTGLTDIAGPRIHTQQVAGLPLIHVATPRMTRSRRMLKRLVDIVGALGALIAFSPIMLVVALAVKAHDRGPVLFRQQRVGLDGTHFKMLKFRSMYTDAEERKAALLAENESGGDVLFKMKDDPRVTGPGKVLRRYSLDELPQFLNVLRGDMSLVGPRPPLDSEVSKYDSYVHRRLRVKPGITGLWQVSGRSDLDWEQAVRLDLYYVENWSVLEDLLILLRTVKAVFAHEGAY